MGGCCGRGASSAEDEKKQKEPFTTGGGKDLSDGPIVKRGCTDILCIVIFIVHWLIFLVVTFVGVQDGDIRKLYKPRDYKGDYCGVGSLESNEKLVQMMNTTEMVDLTAKQLVCSSVASSALSTLMNASEYDSYLCACCLTPCESCASSLGIPDLSDPSAVQATISGSMLRFTNVSNGVSLFSGSASSYASLSPDEIFSETTKYFISVCYQRYCAMPGASSPNGTNGPDARTFRYTPDPDSAYKKAWELLATDNTTVPAAIRSVINESFTFKALPYSLCPYEPRYCIPMPGVNFTEAPNDYCIPRLDSSVSVALGDDSSSVLEGLGSSSIVASSEEGLGSFVGQIFATLDALFILIFWSFMIGLLFMVLLRFFVGCFIWSALGLILVFLVVGGGVAYVRSSQCKGASLLDSGTQAVSAVTIAATSAAVNALTGTSCSEAMSGDGADYRGCQTRTRSGHLCQRWDTQGEPHNHTWTPANYPAGNLSDNYCRNPNNGTTIWCVTTATDKVWESCLPIGMTTPPCRNGYEMETKVARDALKICAYVVWVLAGLWVLLVLFLYSRIVLAISINKVAAMFIYHTPTVLLVPILQILGSVIYSVLWAFSAAFLISQVPASYTSSESYATWAEAMGTSDTPGACNPKWPAGFGWKYGGDFSAVADPCSGNMGDTTGITPRCWRCAPPRYLFDWYFAFSFFSYLWNNALFVAMGQCIIACAVGFWFFTQKQDKGRTSHVWRATRIVLRYHVGTLAFGSFIIAVVQFIRWFLYYLQKQAEAQKNYVMVLVLRVLQCCMWCFEKCLKFLTKNAYIQTALLGTNFCTSAKNAFFLILRNLARFATMLALGAVIQFVGSAFIMVSTTLVGYFILQLLHPNASPVMPVLIYFAISYMVAKLFMNVFGLAVDTALQCFIVAEEQKLDKDCVPGPLKKLVGRGKRNKEAKVAPEPDDDDS